MSLICYFYTESVFTSFSQIKVAIPLWKNHTNFEPTLKKKKKQQNQNISDEEFKKILFTQKQKTKTFLNVLFICSL